MSEDVLLSNPVLAVKKPKLKQVRPNRRLTVGELSKICGALYPGARRFFLAFCETGARLAELRSCNVAEADLQAGTLRLFGKGGKERLIPINDVLANVIGEEPVGRQDSRPDEPLFRNRKGRRYRSLRTPLSRARRVSGEEHCWHHSHRHRNATLQRKGGTDMVLISKLLGHANPTVTQIICVDPLPDDVRRTAKSS